MKFLKKHPVVLVFVTLGLFTYLYFTFIKHNYILGSFMADAALLFMVWVVVAFVLDREVTALYKHLLYGEQFLVIEYLLNGKRVTHRCSSEAELNMFVRTLLMIGAEDIKYLFTPPNDRK